MNNMLKNDVWISQGKVATVYRGGAWASVKATDVKFSQDSTRQQSLKSVNF